MSDHKNQALARHRQRLIESLKEQRQQHERQMDRSSTKATEELLSTKKALQVAAERERSTLMQLREMQLQLAFQNEHSDVGRLMTALHEKNREVAQLSEVVEDTEDLRRDLAAKTKELTMYKDEMGKVKKQLEQLRLRTLFNEDRTVGARAVEDEIEDLSSSIAALSGEPFVTSQNTSLVEYEHIVRELKRRLQAGMTFLYHLNNKHRNLLRSYKSLTANATATQADQGGKIDTLSLKVEHVLDKNMQLAAELCASEDSSHATHKRCQQLEDTVFALRQLLRNQVADTRELAAPTKAQERFWNEVATPELLAQSAPPAAFPKPSVVENAEIEELRFQLKQAQNDLRTAAREAAHLRTENVALEGSKRTGDKKLQAQNKKLEGQLVGAVRRIHWLLSQQAKMQTERTFREQYLAKLESKLVVQSKQLSELRQQLKQQQMANANPVPTIVRPRLTSRQRQAAAAANDPMSEIKVNSSITPNFFSREKALNLPRRPASSTAQHPAELSAPPRSVTPTGVSEDFTVEEIQGFAASLQKLAVENAQ